MAAVMVLARVVTPHEPGLDYHEWITGDVRVHCDRLGRPHPRIIEARWVRWTCNNTECPALAFVSDENSLLAIREAESA